MALYNRLQEMRQRLAHALYNHFAEHLTLYVLGVILGTTVIVCAGMLIFWITSYIQAIPNTLAVHKQLVSKITSDTPISGFYGPGVWLAWLLTIGMTQGHTLIALLTVGHLPPAWDYDLIVVSSYTIVATIDLILKSHTIAQLGDQAFNSELLPALICAERTAAVGMGASVFSAVLALCFGDKLGVRQALVASLPLLLTLVASIFSQRAHDTIATAGPVIWCSLHNNSDSGQVFTLVDFMGVCIVGVWASMVEIYQDRYWWKSAGWGGAISVICALIYCALVRQHRVRRILRTVSLAVAGSFASFALFPSVMVGLNAAMVIVTVVMVMGIYWCPVYILSFFPQMGYFPVTGISLWEMDQIAALLSVVGVAGLRSWTPVMKFVRSRCKRHVVTQEDIPLLSLAGEVV